MIKKSATFVWSLRKQFVKYAVVGVTGFIIDFTILIGVKEFFNTPAFIAVIISQAFALTYNFTMNKFWSFGNKAMPHKQVIRYASLAAFNYLFSAGAMWLFSDMWGYDYKDVRVLSLLVMVSWNFLLYKYWVYTEEHVYPLDAEEKG